MKELNFIEIAPRDGFQNVKEFIPTEVKKEIIDRLVKAGIKTIQVTSFVSPKAIPQMCDASEVAQYALSKYPDVKFYALTPNRRGVDNAYKAGIREIAYVISVSESHNKANVNSTPDESFKELAQVVKDYPDMKVNLDVATAFGCPFEGTTSLEKLVDVEIKLPESSLTEDIFFIEDKTDKSPFKLPVKKKFTLDKSRFKLKRL